MREIYTGRSKDPLTSRCRQESFPGVISKVRVVKTTERKVHSSPGESVKGFTERSEVERKGVKEDEKKGRTHSEVLFSRSWNDLVRRGQWGNRPQTGSPYLSTVTPEVSR